MIKSNPVGQSVFFISARIKKLKSKTLLFVLCFVLIIGVSPGYGNFCTDLIRKYEKIHKIPRNLLVAIAMVETGKYGWKTESHQLSPWVLHSQGKGYYFETKEKALSFLKKLLQEGIRNIDVGCMQVNLFHHGKAFTSPEQALDPDINIKYAAKYLASLKERYGSWAKAIAHYHSSKPGAHRRYRMKVYKMWSLVRQEIYDLRRTIKKKPLLLARNQRGSSHAS